MNFIPLNEKEEAILELLLEISSMQRQIEELTQTNENLQQQIQDLT